MTLLVLSFVWKNHPGHGVSALGVSRTQLAVFVPAKGPENIALKRKQFIEDHGDDDDDGDDEDEED